MSALYQTPAFYALEKAAEKAQLTSEILMERAGTAAWQQLHYHWRDAKRIAIVCGKGNNGGDGYVIAKHAKHHGIEVIVYALTPIEQLEGAALKAAKACEHSKIPIHLFSSEADLSTADVIVDALLGIGLKGEVKGDYEKAILAINRVKKPVFAVDIPSGLSADTGNPLGVAVEASMTATFVGRKVGLYTAQGPTYSGQVICHDLGLPYEIYSQVSPSATLLEFNEVIDVLKKRKRHAHKGEFGHVLVVGGDYGMAGAVRMAAEAAARAGAGLTSVATHAEHVDVVCIGRPEIMCHGIESEGALKQLVDKATVIVLGPGLGQSKWSQKMWEMVMSANQPKVVDADALNLLAQQPQKSDQWILTPHPGEAARMLQTTTWEIQKDRLAAAKNIAKQYGGVCVLKGAGTIIQESDHLPGICAGGNPGMASGGMGDVLSGVIGGLVAQGLSLETAARIGVCVHANAGDRAALAGGERGLLASDLMKYIERLVNP